MKIPTEMVKVCDPPGSSHGIEFVNPSFIVATSSKMPGLGRFLDASPDKCFCMDVQGFWYEVHMPLEELNMLVRDA